MPTPPNILLILTDDQRRDTATRDFMPKLIQHIGDSGVTFMRAIAPTPLCAPSRASILTGLRAIHHGLISNYGDSFLADGDTLPVRLKAVGYRTGLFGKYLNMYVNLGPPNRPSWYIPPGWDTWNVLIEDSAQYLGYKLLQGQTVVQKTGAAGDYSTDVLLALAKTFIQTALTDNVPFFAMVTPYAPHTNTYVFSPTDYPVPAPRHRGAYQRTSATIPVPGNPTPISYPLPLYRPPSWNEPDRTDKPQRVRDNMDSALKQVHIEGIRQGTLEALLAVDDLVGDLAALIAANNAETNTVVAYASDNGFQWYEHVLKAKPWAYEEAILVPLLIRYPAVLGTNARAEARLVILPDLTATLLTWAGASASNLDGLSFASALSNPNAITRSEVPLEAWDIDASMTPVVPLLYRGVRTDDWKYVNWPNGDQELYDLRTDSTALSLTEANISSDPYELKSRHQDLDTTPFRNQMLYDLDAGGLGLQTKVGFFKTNLGAGPQLVAGVGFRPKAILFFMNHLGSDQDVIEGVHSYLCIGFAVASGTGNQGYVAMAHSDGSATPDSVTAHQLRNDRCAGHASPLPNNPQQLFDGSFVSFDADGFTVNWNTPPNGGYRVHYFAVGGDYDMTAASAAVAKPLAPGTVSVGSPTDPLNFTPDVVFFMADTRQGLGTVPATSAPLMFGWATRVDGNHGVASITCKAGANPTDTYRLQRSDRCIACLLPDGSAEAMRARVQSWDTNGFTLNFDVADAVARTIVCLAIKSRAVWRSGVLTQPTAGGAQTQNITTGGGPATAALFLSTNDTTEAVIGADARLTIGAASLTHEAWPSANTPERGTVWVGNRDNQATTVARAARDSTRCIIMRTESAPATPSSENARADYNGSRPNGFQVNGFQLDWEAIDITARRILWLAVSRP